MNPRLEKIYNEYSEKFKDFATNFASSLAPKTREEFREFLESEYDKELKESLQYELFLAKAKNRLYAKLTKAQKKLSKKENADLWYTQLFQKFENKNILEDLIKQAMLYLQIDCFTITQPEAYVDEPADEASEQEEQTADDEQEPTDNASETEQEEEPPEQLITPTEAEPQTEEPAQQEQGETAAPPQNDEDDADTGTEVPTQSKSLPSFFTPGGKSGKKR